jgi:Tol biopolymer transport system component
MSSLDSNSTKREGGRSKRNVAMKRFTAAVLLAGAAAFVSGPPASAHPGGKGLIVFQRVLWSSDGSPARIAIFTVRPSGSRLRQVTNPPLGVETGRMNWSPDGRWLAYMRTKLDPSLWRPHIFVMRHNGTHRTDLTRGHCQSASCSGEEDPAWSPDGSRIAFIRLVGETHALFAMRADGTHRVQVIPAPGGRYEDWGPAWSPNGRQLVFRRWDGVRETAALFVVRADGTNLRRITPWTLDLNNRPDWSPDGRWILFQKPDGRGRTQLCLIHPDGMGLRQITHSRIWRWGEFSPDGTMITALREPGEITQDDIYIMQLDGSGVESVTGSVLDPRQPAPPAEGLPDWGPR